ncbi:MAG: NADPH-dependent ferric siderophore reductase [SAR86 cluster bacterium]|uniref:NADPH-dependent ferric siderophore reductase n=1 Tax=SAR86 cluster bacterium TaxID=2030880 RepID=A0A2A5CHZ4_9GAMM|nr:MAG: NADPH-dependent ferric siderophore reductase [SAR86 cluster bacterium]
MAKRETRSLTVVKKQQLTPNMLRITLGGEELENFPQDQDGGYIKLLLETDKGSLKRSYTIRAFRSESLELDVDFVLHGENGHAGPASEWASKVTIGDHVNLTGPGPVKRISTTEDWYFIAGDMTALPAISVNLEAMPRDAKGYAIIEIIEDADKQKFNSPEGIEIRWVINPHPELANSILPDALKVLPWLEGKPNVWLACEFSGMKQLRDYFKKENNVSKNEIYISSYWKIGDTDEGHKKAKALDKALNILD